MRISSRFKPHLPYLIFVLLCSLIAVSFTYLLIPAIPPSLQQIRQYISESENTRTNLELLKEYINKHPENPEAASLFYDNQADYFSLYLPDESDEEIEEQEPDPTTREGLERTALADYWRARKKHAARLNELRTDTANREALIHAAIFDFNQFTKSFYGPSKHDTYEKKTEELDEVLSYPAVKETPYVNIMEAALMHYREDAPLRVLLSKMEPLMDYDWNEEKESRTDLSQTQKQQLLNLVEERNILLKKYENDALREIDMNGNLQAAYFTLLTIYKEWKNVFPGKLQALIFSKEYLQYHNPLSNDLSDYYDFSASDSVIFMLKYLFVKSFFYLFLAFLGTFIWALFYYFADLFEREKVSYTFIAFIFGLFSAIGVIFINIKGYGLRYFETDTEPVDFLNRLSFYLTNAGMPEEASKFLFFLLFYIIFRKQINESFDYILYPAFVALGFAFIENLIYINHANYEYAEIIYLRALTSLSHCNFTMITGIAFFTAIKQPGIKRKALILLGGYLIASFYHAFHNVLASYEYFMYFLPVIEFLILQAGIHYMLGRSQFYHMKEYDTEKNFMYYKFFLMLFSAIVMLFWIYNSWVSLQQDKDKMWMIIPFLMFFTAAYYYPNWVGIGSILKKKPEAIEPSE